MLKLRKHNDLNIRPLLKEDDCQHLASSALPEISKTRGRARGTRDFRKLNWVAVKELKVSYHNGYIYIYIYIVDIRVPPIW